MAPARRDRGRPVTLLQALAIACLVLLVGTITHKGVADISALSQRHAGAEFWPALARYLIGNLAGGSSAGAPEEERAP